jgi:serine/threonine protein kinase
MPEESGCHASPAARDERRAGPPIELRSPLRPLAAGYQGEVCLADSSIGPVIVKRVSGTGLAASLRRAMLRREARIYDRLRDVAGIPHCHGLVGEGLVLEYVPGPSLRDSEPVDAARAAFYERLLAVIQSLHRAGVAHADLKRRQNILVAPGDVPCLIDFGAAVTLSPGAGFLRRGLFRQFCRTDLNAWVKLKYRGDYAAVSDADRVHFRPTWIESLARQLRPLWRRLAPGRVRR